MPPTSRLLYYDLGMAADDDGVVEAYSVLVQTKANEDDLRVLVSKGFVRILNDDLVSLICDWNSNNTIRADRYHPSIYQDLLLQIGDNQVTTNCQPSDNQMETEIRLGKDRLDKDILLSNESNRQTDVRRIVDAWNEIGVNKVIRLDPNSNRAKCLGARIRDYGVDAIIEAIKSIPDSDFLMGRATDFQITFDWFVRPNNFPKVLEGNYTNKSQESRLDAILARI